MTVFVSIGNSDDKLTQHEWADFMSNVETTCLRFSRETFGAWASFPDRPFQNACFAFEPIDGNLHPLKHSLRILATLFDQDSIALVEGDVEFLTPHAEVARADE